MHHAEHTHPSCAPQGLLRGIPGSVAMPWHLACELAQHSVAGPCLLCHQTEVEGHLQLQGWHFSADPLLEWCLGTLVP